MEDFERVVKISSASSEAMSVDNGGLEARKTLKLLRDFVNIQQRRARAYAHLKRYYLFVICMCVCVFRLCNSCFCSKDLIFMIFSYSLLQIQ